MRGGRVPGFIALGGDQKKGDDAVKRLIDKGLENTTVTLVCIGAKTAGRKFINYEIQKSIDRGNGLLGIQINHLEDQNGDTDTVGDTPAKLESGGYKIYKYVNIDRLAQRIEEAAKDAGK